MRKVILYADDFNNFKIWEQICIAAGVDASFDKLTLTVEEAEASIIDEDDEC